MDSLKPGIEPQTLLMPKQAFPVQRTVNLYLIGVNSQWWHLLTLSQCQ